MTIQVKATMEQCFPVVLLIMLYKAVLTFKLWIKSLGVTMHSNESY